MRCLAVCQDELVIRMLDEILLPGFEVEFIVENRPLARRLHDAGVHVIAGDPRRTDTFVKADLGPSTCVIVEDNGRRSLKKILEAVRDAGGTLVYVLGVGAAVDGKARRRVSRRVSRTSSYLVDVGAVRRTAAHRVQPLADPRARPAVPAVLRDADRVLILLHNDPDPDAMASGLALRNVLRRTKTTAIIGAMQGVTRPENLRMVNLLDIHVETDHAGVAQGVRPHRDGRRAAALLRRAHRPRRSRHRSSSRAAGLHGASSRTSGPTTDRRRTILTEHLRAVDVNISERTATAMLYAIKSDTLFFNRQTNRVDIEAFSYLYPLADAALIRKMEGAEITLERLDYVMKAYRRPARSSIRCSARFLGRARRAKTSSPTSPTSSCSSKTSSGRSSPASSTTR